MSEKIRPDAGGERSPAQTAERTTEGLRESGTRLEARARGATPMRQASGATASGASAVGAAAFGALAVGALAVGAVAIGRLAIGRLAMNRGHVRSLTIDDLEVGRLRVGELIVEGGDATGARLGQVRGGSGGQRAR